MKDQEIAQYRLVVIVQSGATAAHIGGNVEKQAVSIDLTPEQNEKLSKSWMRYMYAENSFTGIADCALEKL